MNSGWNSSVSSVFSVLSVLSVSSVLSVPILAYKGTK